MSALGPELEFCDGDEFDLDHTHRLEHVTTIMNTPTISSLIVHRDDVLMNASLAAMFLVYHMWKTSSLRQIADVHGLHWSQRDNKETLREKLLNHACNLDCGIPVAIFTTLAVRRSNAQITRAIEREASHRLPDDANYLQVADETLRNAIISEWQATTSTAQLRQVVCAVCARYNTEADTCMVEAVDVPLDILRNDALPARTRPTSYDFDLYRRALLCSKGMRSPWALGSLRLCQVCRRELLEKHRMPKLCLANWLYYGHEALPAVIRQAFDNSTQFDRLLVARARGSRISYRFTELKRKRLKFDDEPNTSYDSMTAQRFVKGNVIVMPQNSTQLNSVLPPPPEVIRDTVCAVFVATAKPTTATIRKLSPVLARKSTIRTIVEFLVAENPYYACDSTFHGLSQQNLDSLFEGNDDSNVPCAMAVGFIENNDAIQGATADYTGRNDEPVRTDPRDGLLMENVGYTCGDDSPVSYQDMKMRALQHCIDGGRFIRSQSGDRFIPDFENPSLLTWMFPHLDPWGIGGFHHPNRTVRLSMEEQVKYLLSIYDSPFECDADFAFVYYNILQKKNVCDSVHFKIKAAQQRTVVNQLLNVDRKLLARMIEVTRANPNYQPQTQEENTLVALVNKVGTVLHDLPGTSGYKIRMRNEIRGLVSYRGTPAFFITLNPSDIHNPVVRLLAGDNINLEDLESGQELTDWGRKLLVARRPAACAKFFHRMISSFIDVILRHGQHGRGLFGKCSAYYGTVEAQARGTLHCHMLIWIEGHPSPQTMRDMMVNIPGYQEDMFHWLESLIKCELLGTKDPVLEQEGIPLARPRYSEADGYVHPGTRAAPQLADMSPAVFQVQYTSFVNELVEQYNWHEHTDTCWKYLKRREPRTDANCRMWMDGAVRTVTTIDDETGSILLRRLHPRIANYNDLVVFCMKCNMDIKHIGSGEGAKALIYYITDYITKSSLPTYLGLAALMYAIKRTDDKFGHNEDWASSTHTSGALNIIINSMLSRQETSHQQVMSYLVGGGDHYTSHRFRVLHFGTFERRVVQYWSDHNGALNRSSITSDDVQLPRHTGHAHRTGLEYTARPNGSTSYGEIATARETATRTSSSDAEDNDGQAGGDNDGQAGEDNDGQAGEVDENLILVMKDGSISATNQYLDYVFRPTSEPFNSMGLYEYVGVSEKITMTAEEARLVARYPDSDRSHGRGRPAERRGEFMQQHPQHNSHAVRKRVIWLVPVILGDRMPRRDRSDEERESWARTVLSLFLPWRSPGELKQGEETWMDAYERQEHLFQPAHLAIVDNMNVLTECKDARDRVNQQRRDRGAQGASGHSDGSEASSRDVSPHPNDRLPASVDAAVISIAEEQRDLEHDLDCLLTLPCRWAIDRCYGRTGSIGTSMSFGTASALREEDQGRLDDEKRTMKSLKRKRAMRRSPPAPSTHRRRERPAITDIAQLSHGERSHSPAAPMILAEDGLPSVVHEVIEEFRLQSNPEQSRAFEIVARHVCYGGKQLLMYVGGVGGTGKSHVVNAILRLFDRLSRRGEIHVSAPTGAAAILIGGYTIHSLVSLPAREGVNLQELANTWRGVRYVIIDEVSMVGAALLQQISARLQHAKGGTANAEDLPFGGINVIFTGDFGQLKPVGEYSLYNHDLIRHPSMSSALRLDGMNAMKGVYLWRLVRTVVLLKKNQRQSGDREYAALLSRVRTGESEAARWRGDADDFATLQTRLLQNIDNDSVSRFRATEFGQTPIIVGHKQVRDLLNRRILAHHAAYIGAEVHKYYSRDRVNGTSPSTRDREKLWLLASSRCDRAPGYIPLFPGMKVMVQENVAFANNVVNGAVGTVRDIRYEEDHGARYASVVYVEIPGAGRVCGNIDNDVVPIFPVQYTFKWTRKPGTDVRKPDIVKVTRTQLPLLPAYSYTDYKSQGRSLDNAIVDPATAQTLQGLYVMLSRVRNLSGLGILRPFRSLKVYQRLSQELREELTRLETLDSDTTSRYHTDPVHFHL